MINRSLYARLLSSSKENLLLRHASTIGICLCTVVFLTSCAASGTAERLASIALEVAGLRRTDAVPDSQRVPRVITFNLYGGEALNADEDGRPLALVVRLFYLRNETNFRHSHFKIFGDPKSEKAQIGADLVATKEITITPGKTFSFVEKVSKEAGAIGVVALYLAPNGESWRAIFDAEDAEENGVAIGFNRCAISIGNGAKNLIKQNDRGSTSSARCR